MGGRRGRAERAASPAEAAAGAGQGAREKQVSARAAQPQARELRSPAAEAEGRSPREPGTAAASERAGFAPGRARSEVRAMGEEKYLPELMAEKDSLDPSFVHASRLLAEGRTGPGACQPGQGEVGAGGRSAGQKLSPGAASEGRSAARAAGAPQRLNY